MMSSNKKSHDFYIIHGTTHKHLLGILKDGFIDPNPKERMAQYKIHINQIFTQVIYKDIPNEKSQYPFWGGCCVVISKKILRDFPWYCLRGVGGADDHTFRYNMNRIDKESRVIQKSWGKLDHIPNITKTKNGINWVMTKKFEKFSDFRKINFIHSHELMFNRRISLKKYAVCIVSYSYPDMKTFPEIDKYCELSGIPIIYLPNVFYGINKLITKIDHVDQNAH